MTTEKGTSLDIRAKKAVIEAVSILKDISMKLDHIIIMLREDFYQR